MCNLRDEYRVRFQGEAGDTVKMLKELPGDVFVDICTAFTVHVPKA